jgi:hypothetical protein
MKLISFFALILLLAAGCQQKESDSSLPTIDIVGNLEAKAYRQVPMSEYISEVEYVPLETGADFLVGALEYNIIATGDCIFVAGGTSCYTFSRDGKYMSHIGREGRGPGEYDYISDLSVDATNEKIYINSSSGILEYSWDGKFSRNIEKPTLGDDEYYGTKTPSNISHLRDNLFIGFMYNDTGHEPYGWIIFDDSGAIVKKFPQTVQIDLEEYFPAGIFGANQPRFASDTPYLKEALNDTLYYLSPEDELVPEFVFDSGRYGFPFNTYITQDNFFNIAGELIGVPRMPFVTSENVFFPTAVGEGLQADFGVSSEDYGSVLGLYDIASGKTELLDRDPVTRKLGLINDIDGGLSFWPQYYNESSGELVQVLEAYELKDLLTEEYFAAHPAKDPAAHARLREMLANLKEDDNPVVVIAKLKEQLP